MEYMRNSAAVVLWISLCSALVPNGKIKRISNYIGYMVLILALISPIVRFDSQNLKQAVRDLREQVDTAYEKAVFADCSDLDLLIKEECEAYILDMASQMGVSLDVEVLIECENDLPCPASAKLSGILTPDQQKKLSLILEQNLGIPILKQEWNFN